MTDSSQIDLLKYVWLQEEVNEAYEGTIECWLRECSEPWKILQRIKDSDVVYDPCFGDFLEAFLIWSCGVNWKEVIDIEINELQTVHEQGSPSQTIQDATDPWRNLESHIRHTLRDIDDKVTQEVVNQLYELKERAEWVVDVEKLATRKGPRFRKGG